MPPGIEPGLMTLQVIAFPFGDGIAEDVGIEPAPLGVHWLATKARPKPTRLPCVAEGLGVEPGR